MESSSSSAAGTGTPLRRLVTPAAALYSPEFLGLPPPQKPDQAARLLIARGRYPLPTVLVLGRRMVVVDQIHQYIDSLQPQPSTQPSDEAPPQAPRRRRGRPTNAELAARRAAAAGQAGEVGHD